MGQYCDSNKLEMNWFCWLLASSVPSLELYRGLGLLWTKVVGVAHDKNGVVIVKNGRTFPDAMQPLRLHCIATANPIYFESNAGEIPRMGMLHINNKIIPYPIPQAEELTLLSDSRIHNLDYDPYVQYDVVIPALQSNGYLREIPTMKSWHAVLAEINKMCSGIATKFKPPTDEEQCELANDALLQVTNKLKRKTLTYTPGRAPVFNLLTTTIFRCMYSIMNKRKTQREGMKKFLDDAKSGSLPKSQRSFRVQTDHLSKLSRVV